MTATPALVQDIAKGLQDVDLKPARAAELAIELTRLNETVQASSISLDFDAEPASFLAVLGKRAP
jgi:hypothetical protein